jgi:DNA-binding PadR family transcriptional regulator
MPEFDAEAWIPLKPQDFQILLVLLDETRHGYGIMKAVEERTRAQVRLELGSLYRLLGRLADAGLIVETPAPAGDDPRRKHYGITANGRAVVRAEADRLRRLVTELNGLALGEEGVQ